MKEKELTGLVVCGGASSRMGVDKSLIRYHNETQRRHVARILNRYCSSVYLSLNKHQQAIDEVFPVITDLEPYAGKGPMAALLSAFQAFPGNNFILIGCDYPLLSAAELDGFITSIHDFSRPSAFFNKTGDFYEPLLAFYPATTAAFILEQFNAGNPSLQRVLKMLNSSKYFPVNENSIKSIDDPEASRQILQQLKGKKSN